MSTEPEELYEPSEPAPDGDRSPEQKAAIERARRTLWQGLGVDVLVAIAVVVLAWAPDADLSSRTAWLVLATTVAKTALTAVASYVARLKLAPTEETTT